MHPDCVSCFLKQANKQFARYGIADDVAGSILSRFNLFVAERGFRNVSSPEASCRMHRLLKKATRKEDPYETEKVYYNNLLMSLEEEFRILIKNSDDPIQTALRYALAGNIIDFGPPRSFDVFQSLSGAVTTDPVIDHSAALHHELSQASSVLYLGDNAGEIVLDKLFIEALDHPNLTFAVRGSNVINDVTTKDAEAIGMQDIASVLSNGYDAPSTLLDRCSPDFISAYHEADVVISKGQGNLEGLIDTRDKKIFFLLMVKCDVIAQRIGVPENSSVVLFNQTLENTGIEVSGPTDSIPLK